MTSPGRLLSALTTVVIYVGIGSSAQTTPGHAVPGQAPNFPAPQSAAPPATLPFPVQMKNTILFITSVCLHQPTDEERAAMNPLRLETLNPDELAAWNHELAGDLTPESFASLPATQKSWIKLDRFLGTGFLVSLQDDRLPKDRSFVYLVTNRHVVEPGIQDQAPCDLLMQTISVNHRKEPGHPNEHAESLNIDAKAWSFSSDPAVDLAVVPVQLPLSEWDVQWIPEDMFSTQEMVDKHEIVEGDPVTFAGLFIQYAGGTRLEPIVRSGSVAMLPEDMIPTTLRSPGYIYLVEAHAFGGNSGSPVFVDVNRFESRIGYDYRLLGVVAGEVYEDTTLTLNITTTYNSTVHGNSNISVVVPAYEIKEILDSPNLRALRDLNVKNELKAAAEKKP